MKTKYTPERIEALQANEIFVFGSTLKGVHKGGAAKVAVEKFGAIMGQGKGLQGKSYAIPTMQNDVRRIEPFVQQFIEYAKANPNLIFYVTKIGCGRAGYKETDIAPLFVDAYLLENVVLPKEFCDIIANLIPDSSKVVTVLDDTVECTSKEDTNVSDLEEVIINNSTIIDTTGALPQDKEEIFEIEQPKIDIKVVGKIDVSKYERKKKEIKADCKNIYIIDTNVFVECPSIISKISNIYEIVLSAKVIDELDKLKVTLDDDKKLNVQKALRLINSTIGKREIKMEYANPSLLPEDFNKKSPDNLILSVALKFKNDNPILLTSDNGLQIKAKMMGITTLSLKDFL